MSGSKHKLDTSQLVDEFFEDCRIIGLVSQLRDYQLCWLINQQLHLDFRVNNDLEIAWTRKGKNCYFTVYEYPEPLKSASHYIYNNHCRAEFLLPELKHMDFIWLIRGDYYQDEEAGSLLGSLKKLGGIQMAAPIVLQEVSNRQNLIY